MATVNPRAATLPGGLVLPYAEAGDVDGVPVVFVHGYVDSWRSFEGILARLPGSVHGYALTQRGHGDAGRPPAGYRIDDFAADLVGFMDSVGIDRAVLVGHSSGCIVAEFVAAHDPERVNGLALIGAPAIFADKPGISELWDTVATLEDPVDPAFAARASTRHVGPTGSGRVNRHCHR